MRKSIPLKIVAAGAGILMTGGVAAAAVTTPDAATDGLTNASEKAGFEVPTSGEAQPAKNQNEVEDATVEETTELEVTTTTEGETEELDGEGTGPVDNHGAVVSEFAQTTELEGRERGQAVAEVARSDEGKPETANSDTEDSTTEESGDDGSDGSDQGADAGDQAATQANGKRG